jgi:hypothetical protein
MSLVLQSSGGGSVTIAEPTTASNFTQTLPAADGTLVLAGTTPTFNGITFPATAVPSADANTLDDYEEGTWSPTVGGNATYSRQSGFYTKIGRQVVAMFDIQIGTIGTGSTTQISGLPFTSAGVGSPQGITAPISYWEALNVNAYWLAWRLDEGQTTLFNAYTIAAGAVPSVNGAILKNGTRNIGTVIYFV